MLRFAIYLLLIAGGVLGCDSSSDPAAPAGETPTIGIRNDPVPDLETVPYDRLAGGRKGFHRQGVGVYVVDGASRTSVGYLGGSVFHDPRISPDGIRIAFRMRTGATFRDVYLARLDGTGLRQLSAEPDNFEGPPSWTPNGRYVVFTCCRLPGQPLQFRRGEAATGGLAATWLTVPDLFGSTLTPVSANQAGTIAVAEGIHLIMVSPVGPTVDTVYSSSSGTLRAPAWDQEGQRVVVLELELLAEGYGETRVITADMRDSSTRVLATVFEAVAPGSVIPTPTLSVGQPMTR
jgi:Tol biopolymer transport system component